MKRAIPLCLFLIIFFVFSLTLSYRPYGYEDVTLENFRSLFYLQRLSSLTVGGILDIFSYLPMEWVNLVFAGVQDYDLRDFISLHTLPLMTALLCLVFYFTALELYRTVRVALGASLLLAFTSMVWPYSKMGMEIQHALWSLMAFLMLVRWEKKRRRRDLVLCGLFAGMILLTKVYGFVMAGIFVLYLLWDGRSSPEQRKKLPLNLVLFLAALLPCVILFFIQNRLRFGAWLLGSRYNLEYEAKTIPIWQPIFGFLLSSGKSVFIYNPPLVVALCFIPSFFRRFRGLRTFYILAFGLGLLFHSLLWIWTDETWGPRKLFYLVPLGMLPLGLLVEHFRDLSFLKRLAVIFIILLGVFVQLLGIGFSYESQPVLLHSLNLSSLENLRYQPRFSHTTINYSLLESTIDKYLVGESHYFLYEPTFFGTVAPTYPPAMVGASLKPYSRFDFWFLDYRPSRDGDLRLSQGLRIYFSFLMMIIPVLFLGIYMLVRKKEGERDFWYKKGVAWVLLLFILISMSLMVVYNRAYARELESFTDVTQESYNIAIGNDLADEYILWGGWRNSEWMNDPADPDFEIPFRWTNQPESYLYFPSRPYHAYRLTLDITWVFPTPLSIWVNDHRIGYLKGRKNDSKSPCFEIPQNVVGDNRICEVIIQNHKLHVPMDVDPEKYHDRSTLGVMVSGVKWEMVKLQ